MSVRSRFLAIVAFMLVEVEVQASPCNGAQSSEADKRAGVNLVFGGLPPVSYGEFVSTPVEVTKGISVSYTKGTRRITEWTLTVETVSWDDETTTESFQRY